MPAQMDFRWWSSCLGICDPIPWSVHSSVGLNNQCVSLHRISLNICLCYQIRGAFNVLSCLEDTVSEDRGQQDTSKN